MMCCVSLSAVGASQGKQSRAESLAYEISLKSLPGRERPEVLLDTANYTASTVGGISWSRPFADCTGLSGLGPVVLHSQQFSVGTAGAHTISSVQTGGWDGYIFVYQNAFDPTQPNTNCVIGDDDGNGGIGTSDIDSVMLMPGITYFLVTTGFENGEEGSFTNTISGPGTITLGPAGPAANLGLTKSAPDGVVNGGSYRYRLVANNAGPDDATGVAVSDTLPAGVTFVSSTCGATAAGGTVSWTIGALANGASATCDITVNRAAMTCSTVTNTATISGTEPDPAPANNTATHSNGGAQLVVDGGFEAANAPAWTQASSNFGSPLCDTAGCGTGNGTAGPRSGSQWMWFGGAGTALETGSVEQNITIPAGANTLTFGYWLGACGTGGAADFIRLTVGGTELWRRDASSAECAAAGYSVASVDVSALATGASRLVRFESTTGTNADNSNFHIDDVSLVGTPVCVAPAMADLVLTQTLTPVGAQALGSAVNVGLTLQNLGPGSASGVSVTTNLPVQLSFVGSTCGATAVGSVVTWTVGSLANGASATCTINTTIAAAGGISVASSASSPTTDPVPANNSASSSLGGVSLRPAVIPASGSLALLALLLSLLAVAGIALSRRHS